VLLERVGENAEVTGDIDLIEAHNELIEEGGDEYEYPSDGHEDFVEGQTQMLEELSGKRLDYAERAALADASRAELDPLGRPNVQAAWDAAHGEIRDPNTEVGRIERMANEIESVKAEQQAEEELFGSSDSAEDPEGLTGMPKFDSEPERMAFLAQQVEEATEAEEAKQAEKEAELRGPSRTRTCSGTPEPLRRERPSTALGRTAWP
jgi:chromosome segregation ATPase